MKLVAIESPLRGDGWATLSKADQARVYERNKTYARACMRDSLGRGEAPYASHLLLAQDGILDDTVPDERERGIEAGLAWAEHADLIAVYIDRGMSSGMRAAIERAKRRGAAIEMRTLDRGIVSASESVREARRLIVAQAEGGAK